MFLKFSWSFVKLSIYVKQPTHIFDSIYRFSTHINIYVVVFVALHFKILVEIATDLFWTYYFLELIIQIDRVSCGEYRHNRTLTWKQILTAKQSNFPSQPVKKGRLTSHSEVFLSLHFLALIQLKQSFWNSGRCKQRKRNILCLACMLFIQMDCKWWNIHCLNKKHCPWNRS